MANFLVVDGLTDAQFEQLRQLLAEMDTPAKGPDPGIIIQQWLNTIPPQWLEQVWLTDDFAKPKGAALLEALVDRVTRNPGLWTRG